MVMISMKAYTYPTYAINFYPQAQFLVTFLVEMLLKNKTEKASSL